MELYRGVELLQQTDPEPWGSVPSNAFKFLIDKTMIIYGSTVAAGIPNAEAPGMAYPNTPTTVSGHRSWCFGEGGHVESGLSYTFGADNVHYSTAAYSISVGWSHRVRGVLCAVFGYDNAPTVNAFGSVICGYACTAEGQYNYQLGKALHTKSYLHTAVGALNEMDTGTADSWVSTDPVFSIGAGTDTGNRFSVMKILKNYEMQYRGSIYLTDSSKRIILKDTQATPHKWGVYINNSGVLTTEDLGVA